MSSGFNCAYASTSNSPQTFPRTVRPSTGMRPAWMSGEPSGSVVGPNTAATSTP